MTPGELPNISVAVQDYARVWAECASKVLEQVHGAPFTAAPQTPALGDAESQKAASADAVADPPADSKAESSAGQSAVAEDISVCLKVSGRLAGEQRFQLAPTDGLRLAQLLMSESVDPSVPFTDGHMEALHELFRQFAGLAASACKAKYGGEVEFALDTAEASSEFHSAGSAIWEFTSANISRHPLVPLTRCQAANHAAISARRSGRASLRSCCGGAKRGCSAKGSAFCSSGCHRNRADFQCRESRSPARRRPRSHLALRSKRYAASRHPGTASRLRCRAQSPHSRTS